MPTPTFRVPTAVPTMLVAIATIGFAFMFASLAEAKSKTVPADLRVVSSAGKSLADGTQYSGPVEIKTDKKADCFGEGTGEPVPRPRFRARPPSVSSRRAATPSRGSIRCP